MIGASTFSSVARKDQGACLILTAFSLCFSRDLQGPAGNPKHESVLQGPDLWMFIYLSIHQKKNSIGKGRRLSGLGQRDLQPTHTGCYVLSCIQRMSRPSVHVLMTVSMVVSGGDEPVRYSLVEDLPVTGDDFEGDIWKPPSSSPSLLVPSMR